MKIIIGSRFEFDTSAGLFVRCGRFTSYLAREAECFRGWWTMQEPGLITLHMGRWEWMLERFERPKRAAEAETGEAA